jgi:hypothetical protein
LEEGKFKLYAEHSRYWKLVDPNINDPKSIQNKSTDMVFFIVKNDNGEWVFPNKPIL